MARVLVLVLVAVGVGLAGACGGSSQKTPACMQGAEDCVCYGNMTCNTGLSCLSNLCVNPLTGNGGKSGTGGATGSAGTNGGAGTTGTGGTIGTAGTTGSGGTNGGAGTTGTGGSVAPANLIKNGDFSLGKEYWDLTLQAGDVGGSDYSGGQYCVANLSTTAYLSFSLGYPPTPSDAFAIVAGATYTLSYTAAGTYTTTQLPTAMVKIGHVEAPYTELYSTTDVVTNNTLSSPQTFTHTISSATGDTAAGLVFNGTLDYYSEICFDNVTLVKN